MEDQNTVLLLASPGVEELFVYLLGFWYMSQPFPLQLVHSFIPVDKILKTQGGVFRSHAAGPQGGSDWMGVKWRTKLQMFVPEPVIRDQD